MLLRAIFVIAFGLSSMMAALAAEPPGFDILSRIEDLQNDRTCRNAAENAFNGVYDSAQLTLDARSCSSRYGRGSAKTFVGLPTKNSQLLGSFTGPISTAINGCKIETVLRELSAIEDTVKQELWHRWSYLHGIVEKTSRLATDLESGIEPITNEALSAEDRAAATDYLKRTGLIEIEGPSDKALLLVREKVLADYRFYIELLLEKEVVYSSQVRTVANDWTVSTNRPNCPPITTSGVARKDPKPPARSKPPAGSDQPPTPLPEKAEKPGGEPGKKPEGDVTEEVVSRPDVTLEFIIGGRYLRLPDLSLGIKSLNTNRTPLHNLDADLYGPVVTAGIKFGPTGPFNQNEGWHGGIDGEYARLFGGDRDKIASFPGGQLPTYIDITGTGGFGFNDNSRIDADFDRTTFKISGELGFQQRLSDRLFVRPYGGLLYRFNDTGTNVSLETDYLGGTFVNTLTEDIRENQFGFDAGLDLTHLINANLSMTVGGHVGGIFTNAKYRGSDCGDGSTATPGCDGTLFQNSGITTGNNSFDVFGGLKAALGFYVFCRDRKTEIQAGVISAAVDQLKNRCVEMVASAEIEAVPTTEVNRPSSIGAGQQMQLGTAYSVNSTVRVGVKIKY